MKSIQTDSTCAADSIKHRGIVKNIDKRYVYVSIVTQSACASCSIKGACNITEINEEVIEIPRNDKQELNVGEKVTVSMHKTLGTKAVLLGYFLPFLLLLFTLIITLSLIPEEGIAGIISLMVLVPYFFILYLKRDKLKKTFVFRVE